MPPTTQPEKQTLLSEHFLLRHLQSDSLDELARYARSRTFKRNEKIFEKGAEGSGMMAVIDGRVRVSSISLEGKEVVLEFINPGEVLGEIALIDGMPRTADATAVEDTEVLVLERRDFLPFLERHPRTSVKLMSVLCARMRQTNEMVEDALFLDLKSRLAKRLLRFGRTYGEQGPDGIRINLKLSQRELAALIGVARENVNKQLRAWQDEGTIDMERGFITLREPGELEALVGYDLF